MLISIFNSLISWQVTKWLRESCSSTVPLKINAGIVINTVDLFLSLILSSSLLWISNETASHWATLLEKKAWEQRQSLWILFHAHTHRENKLIKFTSLLHYSVPYTAADTEYWFAEGTDKTTSALGLWKWEGKTVSELVFIECQHQYIWLNSTYYGSHYCCLLLCWTTWIWTIPSWFCKTPKVLSTLSSHWKGRL